MRKTKNFINLTNGIEAIDKLTDLNISYDFIRIQSTTLERKDYVKLLLDLDHNFLINLALGNLCIVHDRGTNRNYSRVIYKGLPIIEYLLNRYWYGILGEQYRYTRDGSQRLSVGNEYDLIYKTLFEFNHNKDKNSVKTKLKYYKKFLNDNKVYILGISKSTINDGKYEYFSNMLKQYNNGKLYINKES